MTDATHAGGDGRAEGGAGSDSAETAPSYMYREVWIDEDGERWITEAGAARPRFLENASKVIQRQRIIVGPWEDVD